MYLLLFRVCILCYIIKKFFIVLKYFYSCCLMWLNLFCNCSMLVLFVFFFFKQNTAYDIGVTGVQTCALPICCAARSPATTPSSRRPGRATCSSWSAGGSPCAASWSATTPTCARCSPRG